MKKIKLFIAPHGARNRKDSIFQEIVSLNGSSLDYSHVLYLGPNRTVLSAARNLFFSYLKEHCSKAAYIPFQSMTLKRLAATILETHGESTPISDRIRTLIISEILNEKNIGYARLLSNLYQKFCNYLPEKDLVELKDKVSKLIIEDVARERAVASIEVLEAYEHEAEERKLIDPEGIMRKAKELISSEVGGRRSDEKGKFTLDARRSTFDDIHTLIIDGFFDPTPLELTFMEALMNHAENIVILAEEDTEIHSYFRRQAQDIEEQYLKSSGNRRHTGNYSYPSIEDEVEGIARGVKQLILEGIPAPEITVSFPRFTQYLPMTRRIFRKQGIPHSIGDVPLSGTRPFTLLDEILGCMEENFPRSDFLSILTSSHLPYIPSIIKERAVAFSYNAGIVKGREAWLSIKSVLENSPGSLSEEDSAVLGDFQEGLRKIIEQLEGIYRNRSTISFLDLFEAFLKEHGFFDSLEASSQGIDISERLTKVFTDLRQFAHLFTQENEHPALYLKYMLQDLRGAEENREGVRVLPLEIAAGIESSALFFGGILEGAFPSKPDIDPILPEKTKKALGIPHIDYYLKRQKLYFMRLLNISKREPHFSCPSAEGDKIFLPSPFLDWGDTISPPAIALYSQEEVHLREGMILSSQQSPLPSQESLNHSSGNAAVLQQRITDITGGHFSVTSIDYYRKCPLRFYTEKILGLEMELPPKYEVESRLWGSLAHMTMEELFKQGDIDLEQMEERIFRGLEKSLYHFPIGEFWSSVAREIFKNMLPVLKAQESEIRQSGFSPFMVEESVKAEINGIRLKGKIDRVDIKYDDDRNGSVHLIDYKTGNIDRDSLQLPLYAAMWEKSQLKPVEKVGYYSLKDGKVSWFPKKNRSMQDYISEALTETEVIIDRIRLGQFPPEPFKDTECRYCYHSPLCKK